MYIEVFIFLVYRQLFTFALLKTTGPPRSLFNYSFTKFVSNFQFEKSLIKYVFCFNKKRIEIIIIIIIIIVVVIIILIF